MLVNEVENAPNIQRTRGGGSHQKLAASAGLVELQAIEKLARTPLEHAWSHARFATELERARAVGPGALENVALLQFCRGFHGYFRAHFWIDATPFFAELWKRIKAGEIPEARTKTAACEIVGCSLRWAEMIVAGTAKASNAQKAKNKRIGREVTSDPPDNWSNEDYVHDIVSHASSSLDPLLNAGKSDLHREVCTRLEQLFTEASRTPHVSQLGAARTSRRKVA